MKKAFLTVNFEKTSLESKDERFQKVKIYIAHTGVNYNGTSFSKEVLLKMAKTLPYTPIISKLNDTKSDFGDHGRHVSFDHETKEVVVEMLTHPIGFIPVDNAASIEVSGGKEWLVCFGYIWTRYEKELNLLLESGRKGQSMEITPITDHIDDDGVTHIDDAKFAGLCILGDDVEPAMGQGCDVTVTYSVDYSAQHIKSALMEMVADFYGKKGGYQMPDDIKKKANVNDDEEEKLPSDNGQHTGDQHDDDEEHAAGQPPQEEQHPDVEPEPEPGDSHAGTGSQDGGATQDTTDAETDQEEYSILALAKKLGVDGDVYSINFATNTLVYKKDDKYFACKVDLKQNKLHAGQKEIKLDKDKYAELKKEVESLRKYRDDNEAAKKTALLKENSDNLTDEEVAALEDKIKDMSFEEAERELAFAVFTKMKRNTHNDDNKAHGITAYSFANTEDDNVASTIFGTASKYFK